MTRTPSEIGRSNRNRGAAAERAVVAWLRDNGFPHAERAVRTGYRTADRTSADHGDITGTPGIVWQVKDTLDFEQPAVLAATLADTAAQTVAAGGEFGVLVQRRRGSADTGRWWAWMPGEAYVRVACPRVHRLQHLFVDLQSLAHPVRLTLADVVALLVRAGYGSAPDNLPEVTRNGR